MVGTLRAVAVPRKCQRPDDYMKLLDNNNPPKGEIPKVLWPVVPAPSHHADSAGEKIPASVTILARCLTFASMNEDGECRVCVF